MAESGAEKLGRVATQKAFSLCFQMATRSEGLGVSTQRLLGVEKRNGRENRPYDRKRRLGHIGKAKYHVTTKMIVMKTVARWKMYC